MERETINELLQECLFFTVKKLDRVMDKLGEEAFKSTGLSPTYGFIIITVNERKGISQKEIAELLHMAPSTITRFIEKLQYKDLVYSEHIGRNTFIYPTKKGEDILDEINKAWDKLFSMYSNITGTDGGIELAIKLDKLADNIKK